VGRQKVIIFIRAGGPCADVACDQHRLASGLLNQPVRFPRVTRGASERIFWGSSRLPSCFAAEPKTPEMMVELMEGGFAPVAKVFCYLLLAKRHSSSRCTNIETSIRPKRDDFLWQ
jgi:hypothetical protein